jgi:hypothetical protein
MLLTTFEKMKWVVPAVHATGIAEVNLGGKPTSTRTAIFYMLLHHSAAEANFPAF